MVKWEYDWENTHGCAAGDLMTLLEEKGQEGWELVCIEQWVAYFKRPITEH